MPYQVTYSHQKHINLHKFLRPIKYKAYRTWVPVDSLELHLPEWFRSAFEGVEYLSRIQPRVGTEI